MAKHYLNKKLIPVLCCKAGVPEQDARGKITSHRARSTIAYQLVNGKDPMAVFDAQQWLGHRQLNSTLYYIKPSPTKVAKSYVEAGLKQRNMRAVSVLSDQEAVKKLSEKPYIWINHVSIRDVMETKIAILLLGNGLSMSSITPFQTVSKSGAAAAGEPWKFYDLGHGYCTYDFYSTCPHRMACARCSFYVPKASSHAQLLEGKANLARMREEMPLTDEELAAIEEGIELHEKLLERLADVPTPEGPTPRQLMTIPLRQV